MYLPLGRYVSYLVIVFNKCEVDVYSPLMFIKNNLFIGKNMKKPENSLAAFSAAMNAQFEERKSKVDFSRKLLYELNLQPSDQVNSLCELVNEFDSRQRQMLGQGIALTNEQAKEVADALPGMLAKLEEIAKHM